MKKVIKSLYVLICVLYIVLPFAIFISGVLFRFELTNYPMYFAFGCVGVFNLLLINKPKNHRIFQIIVTISAVSWILYESISEYILLYKKDFLYFYNLINSIINVIWLFVLPTVILCSFIYAIFKLEAKEETNLKIRYSLIIIGIILLVAKMITSKAEEFIDIIEDMVFIDDLLLCLGIAFLVPEIINMILIVVSKNKNQTSINNIETKINNVEPNKEELVCINCGNKVKNTHDFCKACGNKLK